MKKRMLLACALLWAGASASAPRALTPAPETGRFLMTSFSGGQPLWAWCDSPSRVLALIQYAVPATTNPQTTPAELHEWPKTAAGLGKIQVSEVQIGAPDPGAGHIYTPLKLTSGPRKGQSGYYHTSNIENTNDPAYRMTKTGEFKLGNDVYKCRYAKDATFIGVTQKRTVIVWETPCSEPLFCKVTYATRNFDNSRGVFLKNGDKGYASTRIQANRITDFRRLYSWQTSDGFTYDVELSTRGGTVKVKRGSTTLTTEPFLAYSISLPK
ncbi:hypothetical protein [Deinococcus wulumuqiensis]|nr:hypothetical protein [Deinococcus wulumuqiensis]QII21995.1 hypothetical protein G6R31_14045 [Deinococcus wulumuqiensis R12]